MIQKSQHFRTFHLCRENRPSHSFQKNQNYPKSHSFQMNRMCPMFLNYPMFQN
jgi:hypothetical protein